MKTRLTAALLLSCLAGTASATELSLKRVLLSSGGVGYFEYAGMAEGDDSLTLDVPLGSVDDILKSLVVFDSAGVPGLHLAWLRTSAFVSTLWTDADDSSTSRMSSTI